MVAHIQRLDARFDQCNSTVDHCLGLSGKGDDRSMIIRIGFNTQHRTTGRLSHRVDNGIDFLKITSL